MKLTIECTEEQAQLLVNCLEDAFRFRMKQESNCLEHVLWEKYPDKEKCKDFEKAQDRWIDMRDHAEIACKGLMDIIYGKHYTELPKEAHEIADMYKVIRHEIYKAKGGNEKWSVLNDEPFKIGDLPLIKCEVELNKRAEESTSERT